MGRPRTHGADTEAELLGAAARLIGTEGAQSLTIRRVADEVGTTTRAVYSIFGDKSGLLRVLFHQIAATMTRYHEDVPVLTDSVQEILELALAYRRGALQEANLYQHLYLGTAFPEFVPDAADLAVAYRSFDRVLAALQRCAGAGRLGNHDPAAVTHQMWALVHGLASLELMGFLGDPDKAIRHWTDAVAAAMSGYAA
jgi:AcrR family transcriptional regulator